MLSLQARMDQGVIAMKGYSAFPKVPVLLEPRYQIVWSHMQDTLWGGVSFPSAEMQSVYSTAPDKWVTGRWVHIEKDFNFVELGFLFLMPFYLFPFVNNNLSENGFL